MPATQDIDGSNTIDVEELRETLKLLDEQNTVAEIDRMIKVCSRAICP